MSATAITGNNNNNLSGINNNLSTTSLHLTQQIHPALPSGSNVVTTTTTPTSRILQQPTDIHPNNDHNTPNTDVLLALLARNKKLEGKKTNKKKIL